MSRETPTECPSCGGTNLKQDEDVLDTWFSSALWPFSTLGWPEETATLKSYYPTATLVTDRGIIYFWVARMVMMGLAMVGEVPFSDVYIHGTILDEQGRKMSKSLGNGIDPIDVIEKYGADAMRYSLMVLSTEGQDLKLSESRFEMGRNFCNKLWNAARFAMMNLEDMPEEAPADKHLNLADRWILNRLAHVTRDMREALDSFRFSVAAQALYQFVWNEFCDWYVEAAKLHLGTRDSEPFDSHSLAQGRPGTRNDERAATQHTLKRVLADILRLAHPFLPFITEEIWGHLMPGEGMLITSHYPKAEKAKFEKEASSFAAVVIEPVEAIRNIRGESNVPPAKRIPLAYAAFHEGHTMKASEGAPRYVEHLARLDSLIAVKAGQEPEETKKAATAVTENQTTYIPYSGLIDIEAERTRLAKEIARAEGEIEAVERKLGNESFTSRAPSEIVERERGKKKEAAERLKKLEKALKALE